MASFGGPDKFETARKRAQEGDVEQSEPDMTTGNQASPFAVFEKMTTYCQQQQDHRLPFLEQFAAKFVARMTTDLPNPTTGDSSCARYRSINGQANTLKRAQEDDGSTGFMEKRAKN